MSVSVFELSHLFCVYKVSTVTGIRRVGVAILVIVSVFELSHFFLRVESVSRHRDQAGHGRHPGNCQRV